MKTAFLLLASLPGLACAAATGTVALLDGTPLAGAVVRMGTNSVQTSASGSFVVERATRVERGPDASRRVSTNLSASRGRISLSWNGSDALGRGVSAPAEVGRPTFRSLAGSDTLAVYWKGKRLVALPLPSDSGSLSFRIDTAWSDDAGIPWNAHVSYGSLPDARDGRTYRTVPIGARTWMAENLAFVVRPGAGTWVFGDSAAFTARLGRLYSWATALGLADSCDERICSTQVVSRRGVCPAGWSVPTDAEWTRLVDDVEADPRVGTGQGNAALKSVSGWVENGYATDLFGFRGLPAGWNSYANYRQADSLTYFRTATEYDETSTWGRDLIYGHAVPFVFRFYFVKYQGYSLRCIRD